MKRIWKKPGTIAWKKAMEKSASRMARGLMRVPGGREHDGARILLDYLKNKPAEQRSEIVDMVEKAAQRRGLMISGYGKEFAHLDRQYRGLFTATTLKIIKQAGKVPIRSLRIVQNNFKTMEDNLQRQLQKIRIVRKMMPKEKRQEFESLEPVLNERLLETKEIVELLEEEIREREGQ